MKDTNRSTLRIPHAAVVVWNYRDRIGNEGVVDVNNIVEPVIISTVSCISIETNKSKSQPAGSFQLVLAPSKNWVSTLVAGSWCVIMMSNKPITQDGLLNKADPELVKMIGKIETVRCETRQVDDQRQTLYYVSGTDWGHIFNNTIYIDPLIAGPNDPTLQGNAAYVAIRNMLFQKDTLSPPIQPVSDLLKSLTAVFGNDLGDWQTVGDSINRLAKSSYDFVIPQAMANFFQFQSIKFGPMAPNESLTINNILQLKTGRLSDYNKYDPIKEASGFIDPFTLAGTNTFWQILMDNSNPALNEMYNEIEWTQSGQAILTLYNRIKPFSYQSETAHAPENIQFFIADGIRSMFQNVRMHNLNPLLVTSINAGTNWRDKYNFVEIKPTFSEFKVVANYVKQKTQQRDAPAFNREGFRPLIVGTKQLPINQKEDTIDYNALEAWLILLREWFFNTHRLLNGTLTMQGPNEYIAVGNNIRFPLDLIDPTTNMNQSTINGGPNQYVLAHVESVNHHFGVNDTGARTYTTTIQFVRGIIVDSNNKLIGGGTLDKFADSMAASEVKNTTNTIAISNDRGDPDTPARGT